MHNCCKAAIWNRRAVMGSKPWVKPTVSKKYQTEPSSGGRNIVVGDNPRNPLAISTAERQFSGSHS